MLTTHRDLTERRHTVSQVDYLGREVDEEQTEGSSILSLSFPSRADGGIGANFYFGEGTRHRHQHDARLSHALERDVWRRRSIELEKEAKLTAELSMPILETASSETARLICT